MSTPIRIPIEGQTLQSYGDCLCQADYFHKYQRQAADAVRLAGRQSCFNGRDLSDTARFHLRYIRSVYELNGWDQSALDRVDCSTSNSSSEDELHE